MAWVLPEDSPGPPACGGRTEPSSHPDAGDVPLTSKAWRCATACQSSRGQALVERAPSCPFPHRDSVPLLTLSSHPLCKMGVAQELGGSSEQAGGKLVRDQGGLEPTEEGQDSASAVLGVELHAPRLLGAEAEGCRCSGLIRWSSSLQPG